MVSNNPMLGATLILGFDKQAASETQKALEAAKKQSEALNKTNLNSADAAAQQAKAEIEAAKAMQKATEAAKAKAAATKTVATVLADLQRQKALDELAAKWAKVAKQTKDAAAAQKGLQADLDKMNATQGEIQGAAGQFDAESGTGSGAALRKAGAQIRNLPSIQIPGLGIGTDAVGNLLRVSGALSEVAGKATFLTTTTAALTPALGATGAGFAAAALAIAPFVLVIGGIALVIKSVADQVQARMDELDAQLNARRSAVELAGSGTTTSEAQQKLDEYNETIKTQTRLLEENTTKLNDAGGAMKEQTQASGAFAAGAKAGFNSTDAGRFQAQIDTSNQAIKDATIAQEELQTALEQGLFAANDAAEAEKKLAEERIKATLDSAAAAGQEVAARNRADKASFEQNESRLTAIEDEKEAIEAQLAVLQASGDTSEEVTSEIEKLNGSLNALGKESEYISTTALAASKARDAEKKAIKDREKALEDAERKQEQADQKRLAAGQKYSEALIDIATKAADAAEDALRGLEDKLASNELSFGRDIEKLTLDADRDRLEAEIKAQEEEAADLREHQHKLESIRDDALKDEDDALKKRDFLGAARIREKANQELEAENQAFEENQAEREIAEGEARAREDRELQAARDDRLRALQQQNADARTAYDLRLRDDEIAQDRQRRDAGVNRDREIEAANVLANEVLKIKQLQGQTEIQLAAQTLQGIAQLGASFVPPQMNFAGGAGGNTTNNQNINSLGQLNMPIQTVIAPEMLQTIIMSTIDSIGLMPNN